MRTLALILLVLPVTACDCPDSGGATAGGECNAAPPSEASEAYEQGFFAALYGPYPIVPPPAICPTVDDASQACHDWWDGAGDGTKARAECAR